MGTITQCDWCSCKARKDMGARIQNPVWRWRQAPGWLCRQAKNTKDSWQSLELSESPRRGSLESPLWRERLALPKLQFQIAFHYYCDKIPEIINFLRGKISVAQGFLSVSYQPHCCWAYGEAECYGGAHGGPKLLAYSSQKDSREAKRDYSSNTLPALKSTVD